MRIKEYDLMIDEMMREIDRLIQKYEALQTPTGSAPGLLMDVHDNLHDALCCLLDEDTELNLGEYDE